MLPSELAISSGYFGAIHTSEPGGKGESVLGPLNVQFPNGLIEIQLGAHVAHSQADQLVRADFELDSRAGIGARSSRTRPLPVITSTRRRPIAWD